MTYPSLLAAYARPPIRLSASLGLGSAAALGGAAVIGVFSGVTRFQSAYAAILLGWIVGLVVCRSGADLLAAAGAGAVSLMGSAAASVITVCIAAVKYDHIPASIVAAHFWRAIPLVPHVIGWFGFVCWALATAFSWGTVRRRGRLRSRTSPPAAPRQQL